MIPSHLRGALKRVVLAGLLTMAAGTSAAQPTSSSTEGKAPMNASPRVKLSTNHGDMIIALDALNPQTAARMVPPLGRWRRFDEARAALMKAELSRIVATPGLSKDVFEQVSKSLR